MGCVITMARLLTTLSYIWTTTKFYTYLANYKLTSVKDLGITFDANLSFSAHITTITVSANQRVSLLFRAFHSRNIKTL